MNVVTHEEFESHRDQSKQDIEMPDGTTREVTLTPGLWEEADYLRAVEGITAKELVPYALEEMRLQPGDISFDFAYRIVVTHLANRWTP